MTKKGFRINPAEKFISSADPKDTRKKTPAPTSKENNVPLGYRVVKEHKSIRTQLLFRPTIKDALKKEAEEQNISVNELVDRILEEYLQRKGKV